jgi:hypothetical protein
MQVMRRVRLHGLIDAAVAIPRRTSFEQPGRALAANRIRCELDADLAETVEATHPTEDNGRALITMSPLQAA